MTERYRIVALVLLLAGLAVIANSMGLSCPFSEEGSPCQVGCCGGSERCYGIGSSGCSASCTGNSCQLNSSNQTN